MATVRARALAAIAEHGAELFDDSGPGELIGSVWLPAGLVWRATGCHVIALGFRTDRAAGWAYLLDDLHRGVEPCRQPGCETCEE